MSKLDYCNVALASLPSCDLDRLHSVINAAARLTVGAQRHDHITPLLADLHWLRIPQRIQHKLCVLVYQCIQGCTELRAERHLPGRECGIMASPALRIIGRSHHAGDATYNNGRSRLRRRSTWNCLPDVIRRSPSLAVFKRSLKTHFYIQSFLDCFYYF